MFERKALQQCSQIKYQRVKDPLWIWQVYDAGVLSIITFCEFRLQVPLSSKQFSVEFARPVSVSHSGKSEPNLPVTPLVYDEAQP